MKLLQRISSLVRSKSMYTKKLFFLRALKTTILKLMENQETYSEPNQRSKMKLFVKIVIG